MFEKYSRPTIILALTCALLVGCKSSGSDTAAVAAPDTGGTTPPPASNTAPVISSPGNQTTDMNETVRLPVNASDADGDTLSFSAAGLPAGLDIDSTSGVISGAATSAGTSTVTINVSDGSESDSVSFSWTVSAVEPPPATNSAPVLSNPGDQTSVVNEAVSLLLSASDADGDTLSFSASGLPAGLNINSSSGAISGAASAAGSRTVTVTVSDGTDSDNASFSWTVSAVQPPPATNSAPVLSNPGDQTSTVNQAVSLSLSASDADGDALSFSATGLPAGLDIDSSTGEISGTLSSAGSSTVTVTVSDGTDSDSESFNWTVSDPVLGSVTLSWTPPTQNDDGSPLLDLAGYNIYYGVEQGNYPTKIPIDNPGIATWVVEGLEPNTYYFVATSENSAGIESAYSNVAVKTVPTP